MVLVAAVPGIVGSVRASAHPDPSNAKTQDGRALVALHDAQNRDLGCAFNNTQSNLRLPLLQQHFFLRQASVHTAHSSLAAVAIFFTLTNST